MYDYDGYLSNLAEEHNVPCAPAVEGIHLEYLGADEYDRILVYNCENCEEKECEHWKKYN